MINQINLADYNKLIKYSPFFVEVLILWNNHVDWHKNKGLHEKFACK